jgi:site-specific DNA-methyltransferase (adenine-specific)
MEVNIEDAGFEIRDMIAWVYGSGFPKSLDVSKAIDKAAGAEREVVGIAGRSGSARACMAGDFAGGEYHATAPATPEAQQWAGWGTALKPALEPITVARKPFKDTVAANVLEHGTGAINVDGCRVGTGADKGVWPVTGRTAERNSMAGPMGCAETDITSGRWPANLIHDGSDEVVGLFPQSTSTGGSGPASRGHKSDGRTVSGSCSATGGFGDSGSAARFFYCAKASKADRGDDNTHPTVKPTELMRYLCRLVTPPGGVVLDPFMGSGSTGKAAMLEGFEFIGIERETAYLEIAQQRITAAQPDRVQLSLLAA